MVNVTPAGLLAASVRVVVPTNALEVAATEQIGANAVAIFLVSIS